MRGKSVVSALRDVTHDPQSSLSRRVRRIRQIEPIGDVTRTDVDGDVWRRITSERHAAEDAGVVLDVTQTALLLTALEVRRIVVDDIDIFYGN